MDGIDPAAFGMDAWLITSTIEGTNWVKSKLIESNLDKLLSRFYPLIPFVVGGLLSYLVNNGGISSVIKAGVQYGLWATMVFRGYKVGVQGK